ncbi:MAG: ACP S-malonyltransferase, partial [Chitinophagaceae bacterium]
MKHAFVFPGQGAQFVGMGKNLFDTNTSAKSLFLQANDILGFDITKIMFEGTEEELKETKVTQPAIFLHSIIAFLTIENPTIDMVAGHSLGEFSALVAAKSLSFESGLKLVSLRAQTMQKACEKTPSTMAAILGLEDSKVDEICQSIKNDIVVAANYNCPGQLVISGSISGVEKACELMKVAGCKRVLLLPVSGAFHSPFMQSAQEELKQGIEKMTFEDPLCPIYQNIVAKAVNNKNDIKINLVHQLTGPVKWTQCIKSMVKDGATNFTECGPGKVLQGLIGKITKDIAIVDG